MYSASKLGAVALCLVSYISWTTTDASPYYSYYPKYRYGRYFEPRVYNNEESSEELVEFVPVARTRRGSPLYMPVTESESSESDQLENEGMEETEPEHVVRLQAPKRYPFMEPVERQTVSEMETSGTEKDPMIASGTGHHHHHPYEYVDYGAYTGGWGAFGWYSDHPVYSKSHHHY